jgi:hypothetical protein
MDPDHVPGPAVAEQLGELGVAEFQPLALGDVDPGQGMIDQQSVLLLRLLEGLLGAFPGGDVTENDQGRRGAGPGRQGAGIDLDEQVPAALVLEDGLVLGRVGLVLLAATDVLQDLGQLPGVDELGYRRYFDTGPRFP